MIMMEPNCVQQLSNSTCGHSVAEPWELSYISTSTDRRFGSHRSCSLPVHVAIMSVPTYKSVAANIKLQGLRASNHTANEDEKHVLSGVKDMYYQE